MRLSSRVLCFGVLGLAFVACGEDESAAPGPAGTAGKSGAAAGKAGASGAAAGRGGTAGKAGTSGGAGASGKGGAGGQSGAAGQAGASAKGGASGQAGASGQGGVSGAAGKGGASGQSGASQGGSAGTSGQTGAGQSGAAGQTGGAGTQGTAGTGGAGVAGNGAAGTSAGAGGNGASGAAGTSAGAAGSTGGSGGGTGAKPSCEAASGTVAAKLKPLAGSGVVSAPVGVKGAPGDDSRLFVVQLGGGIRIFRDGVLSPKPFYTVPSLATGGERGLLGFAFHPGYATNGRYFLHYSRKNDGATVIEERVRGADPDVADTGPGKTLLVVTQPEDNHNGGSIEFGHDGFLYIALGDGGGSGDGHGPIGNGQNRNTLLGKILRIDVDNPGTTTPYAIPAGNLTGANTRPEIWDFGLRNPYRVSFDACTGDLYIGDVGQGKWEEIDFEPKGEGRRNYGWRAREGKHCFDNNLCSSDAPQAGMVDPVAEYDHGQGRCSVTGGYVYRGSRVPSLRGTYFYGDFCTHQIFAIKVVNGVASPPEDLTAALDATQIGNIFSFGQDNAGEVYVAASNAIFRIEAAP